METDLQQLHPEVSFHFWNCQLTEASPKYSWDPENWGAASDHDGSGERRQRRPDRNGIANGSGNGNANGNAIGSANGEGKAKADATAAENGHRNGDSNGKGNGKENGVEADEDNGEAAIDTDYMQHVLKVNACILGPKATGVHLISVRTKCYQSEPDTCPIVCIDPASHRTLALAYEFVLDSQNEVTFELTEGTGPVWLTGLHQVRVHEDPEDGEAEGDAEAEGEEVDEAMASDESMKDANDEEDEDAVEEEDDEDEEEEEEEEEEDDEEEEEIRPAPKRVARASKSERPVASPKQPRRRAPEKQPAKSGKAKSASPSPSPPKKKTSAAAAKAVGTKRGSAAAKSKA